MAVEEPVAHDVVRALLDKLIVADVHERRGERRFACFGGISVSVFQMSDPEYHVALVDAVTDGVSQEGLSFLCPRLLHVETPLAIRFESLEDRPVLKCVVRNVVHLGGQYHRVGVKFAE